MVSTRVKLRQQLSKLRTRRGFVRGRTKFILAQRKALRQGKITQTEFKTQRGEFENIAQQQRVSQISKLKDVPGVTPQQIIKERAAVEPEVRVALKQVRKQQARKTTKQIGIQAGRDFLTIKPQKKSIDVAPGFKQERLRMALPISTILIPRDRTISIEAAPVPKQSIMLPTVRAPLTGFEKRVEKATVTRQKLREGSQKVLGKLGLDIQPTDPEVVKFSKRVLGLPVSSATFFLETPGTLKITGEGLLRKESRGKVLQEFGRVAKITPKAVAQSLDPRTGEGLANLLLAGLAVGKVAQITRPKVKQITGKFREIKLKRSFTKLEKSAQIKGQPFQLKEQIGGAQRTLTGESAKPFQPKEVTVLFGKRGRKILTKPPTESVIFSRKGVSIEKSSFIKSSPILKTGQTKLFRDRIVSVDLLKGTKSPTRVSGGQVFVQRKGGVFTEFKPGAERLLTIPPKPQRIPIDVTILDKGIQKVLVPKQVSKSMFRFGIKTPKPKLKPPTSFPEVVTGTGTGQVGVQQFIPKTVFQDISFRSLQIDPTVLSQPSPSILSAPSIAGTKFSILRGPSIALGLNIISQPKVSSLISTKRLSKSKVSSRSRFLIGTKQPQVSLPVTRPTQIFLPKVRQVQRQVPKQKDVLVQATVQVPLPIVPQGFDLGPTTPPRKPLKDPFTPLLPFGKDPTTIKRRKKSKRKKPTQKFRFVPSFTRAAFGLKLPNFPAEKTFSGLEIR